MATEQTITISGTPTVVSGVTVPFVDASDLEIYIGQGKVEKVVLNNAGAGYADATNAALEFSGGGGSSAALTVDVANGQVSLDNSGVPTNKGSGYTTSPIVGFGNISGGTAAAATAEIYVKKTSVTDYAISGNSGAATLTFTSALSNGDKVLIKRVTDVSAATNTFNAGSTITAKDLNDSFNQLRYRVEELPNVTSTALTNGDKGDITVSGDNWTIDDDVVTGSKLSNNIDIAGTLDVTSAAKFDSTVEVDGTTQLDGATTINSTSTLNGATIVTDDLNVKADNKTFTVETAGGVDKFTVDTDNGNTAIAGTLDVTGATGVDGDFDVNTNKFNVTASSGNTTVAGTLTVTGATTLTGALAANAGITVDTDKFTVADSTGNTTIAGTLTTAVQKTVTCGGPLVLSKVSKDVTGLTTLALHASDNTGNNILNSTYLNLYSSSGAVTIGTLTGGVAGQIVVIHVTGDGTSGTSTLDVTLTNTTYVTGTANGFVSGRALDASSGDADIFMYNGNQWINLTVGNN